MFDLLDRPLHWIPVSFPSLIPPEKEGDLSVPGEHTVELRVELIDREEARKYFPTVFGQDDETTEVVADEKNGKPIDDFAIFKRVVKEWRKINGNGLAAPLTDKNIRTLLKVPGFSPAFGMAYLTALAGLKEVREKNSFGSPNGGPSDTAEPEKKTSTKTANGSD